MNAPRPTLPLRITDKGGPTPSVELGGMEIANFIADDGLTIEFEHEGFGGRGYPVVTMKFATGRLDLDFDVELLERLLDGARAKAGEGA